MPTRLRNHAFARLLLVRVASQAADGLFQAGLAWLVLLSPEAQRSPGRFVLVLALVLLPFSVLAPFLSLVLDRWLRRSVLVTAQAVRAGVMTCVALVAWLSAERAEWPVYVLVLVALGLARLLLACLSASVPYVVSAHRLVDANTVGPTLGATAHAGGLGAGALLIASDLGSPVVLVAAVLLSVVASLVARGFTSPQLGPDAGTRPPRPGDVLEDLGAALEHLRRHRPAGSALVAFGSLRVAYGAFTLLAFAATAGRGEDAEAAVAAVGVAAGFALGAVSTPLLARAVGLDRWAAVAGAGGLVVVAASALGSDAAVAPWFACAFTFGVVHQVWKVRTDTVVQRGVDEAYLGRVFLLYDVLNNVTYVTGAAAAALLLA